MSANITLAGARWFSVKWWATNGREDLAERASLSVESLRSAGFLARVGERVNETRAQYSRLHPNETDPYLTLIRVEVYGTSETHERARDHLRGFWAALDSRGLRPDYREGYSAGVGVLQRIGQAKPNSLPQAEMRKLGAGSD